MLDIHPVAQLLLLAAAVVAIARITRLVIFDHYPPMEWVRRRWDNLTLNSGWNLLLHCAYCLAPWVTIVVLGSGWWALGGDFSLLLANWWCTIVVWLAVSYVASMLVAYDGDD